MDAGKETVKWPSAFFPFSLSLSCSLCSSSTTSSSSSSASFLSRFVCVCVCVVSITCVQQVSRRCTTTLSNGVVALKSGLRSQSVPLPKSAPEPPTFADTSSPHLLNDSGQTCGPRIIIAIIELWLWLMINNYNFQLIIIEGWCGQEWGSLCLDWHRGSVWFDMRPIKAAEFSSNIVTQLEAVIIVESTTWWRAWIKHFDVSRFGRNVVGFESNCSNIDNRRHVESIN